MTDTNRDIEDELSWLQPRALSPELATRIQRDLATTVIPQTKRIRWLGWGVVTAVSAMALCLVVVSGIRWLQVGRREVADATLPPLHRSDRVSRELVQAQTIRGSEVQTQTTGDTVIRASSEPRVQRADQRSIQLPDQPAGQRSDQPAEASAADPRLSEFLNDLASDDAEVRTAAARELCSIRPLPASAIPSLLKALDDRTPHSPLKTYAARALSNVGPPAGEALKSRLLKKLRAKDIATADLNEIHSLYEASLPALVELLDDPDANLRTRSLGILSVMGPAAKSAATSVEKRLADLDPGVRLDAARCFWILTGDTRKTIPVLIEELKKPLTQSTNWTEAARTIGDIGPPAKEAVPLLIELLLGTRERLPPGAIYRGPRFPWFHVRIAAAIAIGKIGPDAKAAVPALLIAAGQPDQGSSSAAALRVRSARALWRVAPTHPAAIPLVLRGLNEESPFNQIATQTVILIGTPAKAAVPTLIEQLDREAYLAGLSTIDALGIIGSDARAALPRLEKLLEDQDLSIRKHAQLAITRIGPPEQSVLPLLEAAANTSFDVEVRAFLANRVKTLQANPPVPP